MVVLVHQDQQGIAAAVFQQASYAKAGWVNKSSMMATSTGGSSLTRNISSALSSAASVKQSSSKRVDGVAASSRRERVTRARAGLAGMGWLSQSFCRWWLQRLNRCRWVWESSPG